MIAVKTSGIFYFGASADNRRLRAATMGLITASALSMLPDRAGAEMYFPPNLISAEPGSVADLSYLTPAGTQLPGIYSVDIYLNDKWIDSRALPFVVPPKEEAEVPEERTLRDNTGLLACLTPADWREVGVKVDSIAAIVTLPDDSCVSPGEYIPQAWMAFDFQNMRLDLSIPQAMLKNRPRGWISEEKWDEGITALISGYRLNGSSNQQKNGHSNNLFLSLENGLNLGPWRLRDSRNFSRYSTSHGASHGQWERLNTYASRAIIPLRSELLLGESSTDGDLFDAFPFRGLKLATDDNMYPDTQRGYAPVIKGAAFSNARIAIRQNGNLIYQTFVPPGAYEIDDLYPVSTGGDLDVTVTEADGTARSFTVPYSSVPLLQREGRIRYSFASGRFRSNSSQYSDPDFLQGTLQWGMPHNTTLYGGLQIAEKYRAGLIGAGMNMGSWGALSADLTQASSELADGSQHKGQSLRFLYAHSLSSLGTTFRLAGYRYSSKGFHTLDETALRRMSGWLYDDDEVDSKGRPVPRPYSDFYNLYKTKKTRIQVNMSQRLGGFGSLYLTGSRQTYWNSNRSTDSLTAGYSGLLGPLSYNLSLGYSKDGQQKHSDRAFFLSLSLPFSALLPGSNPYTRLSGNMSRDSNGGSSYMAGISGSPLKDNNLSWNVQQGYSRQGNGGERSASGSANVNYRGSYGSTSLGYSYSKDYRQINYGLSGGLVAHRNGLTPGPLPGTTNVLVAVPGAADIPVRNGIGIRTDWHGYALLPYSMEYRENIVSLDTDRLDEDTEIDNTSVRVIPTKGALVRAEFKAHRGVRSLITLTWQGKPLPFGTIVTAGESRGITGDDGLVYLSGMAPRGELKAQWGNRTDQRCSARYSLSEQQMLQLPVSFAEVCLSE